MKRKRKRISYDSKKRSETDWYEREDPRKKGLASRVLHSRLFYHPVRNTFNYRFPKMQMRAVIKGSIKGRVDRLLIAPCGTGDDYRYVGRFAKKTYGIDLSPVAVKACPAAMEAKVGDACKSGYPDNHFDIVASPLFFHHLLNVGFQPFLKEFRRVLKKGGGLVILEPSVYYPLNLITRPIKHLFGNPFGEVEDEAPFRPGLMIKELKKAGFRNVRFQAASFSHCSTYVPLARFINWITKPLLKLPPFKYFGWMVVYWAEK